MRTALAAAANPLTIVSWAAIVAAASTALIVHTTRATATLLAATGYRSFAWLAVLSEAAAIVGQQGLRIADAVSGLGIMGFGACWAGALSAARDPVPPAGTP